MLEQRIQQQFFESADLVSQTAETLAKPIAAAAQTLLGCITAGGKLILCGGGMAMAVAQHGAALLVGRFERERPGLAALAIGADTVAASLTDDGEASQGLAKQVQALGAPGDVLLALTTGIATRALTAAMQAAHAKEMSVVALTGRDGGGWAALLKETDVLIAVPHDRAARVHEVHVLVLHCLCDAVDFQLLGDQDPV
jgi:D-sedoheptulose 7-phosphate isomerase